ncbi:hypothetical protein AB0K60_19485 [Thermopolyspora sp. NPDC052614]|uniref:hypothetical protein n=1 Tax=Thermopolyspora sp. NPDC052614 TaxID=3155682 RepID=UPI003447F50B
MRRISRMSWPVLAAWVAAAAVAAVPTLGSWWEGLEREKFARTHESDDIYGMVCLFSGGTTLSPLAPLRHDLAAVMGITREWAVPALVVVLGLLACLGGRDPGVTGRRVAGLLVLSAVIEPLASLYAGRSGCGEMISLFSADWFRAAAGGWGTTQLVLLVAAALVFAASRATGSVGARESGGAGAEMVWRRPVAGLVDYLIIVVVFSAVVGAAWPLIDTSFTVRMGAGLLDRAEVNVIRSPVKPGELVILAGVFLYFWVQHALWGRAGYSRRRRVRGRAVGCGLGRASGGGVSSPGVRLRGRIVVASRERAVDALRS